MKRSSLLVLFAIVNLIAMACALLLAIKYGSISIVFVFMLLTFILLFVVNMADKQAAKDRYEEERDRYFCERYEEEDQDRYY